ncbi:TATA box-binding protein-associated factor RNA polymerase I subunit B [Amaranthus tricolor]|uniref:TATA box-binding protein-associated factor RNA polymerase I subunit B n=1 Tax=Amaranthus tricolor TaxID=29722 RepID=UPI00258AFCC3|nr:TATA box-binding protein-associated factor RNA polymerase I subunit B [Amaranthus tricolor]
MAEVDASQLVCTICDHQGLYADDDGHFYCSNCNSQAEGLVDLANDDDFIGMGDGGGGGGLYSVAHKRSVHQYSSVEPQVDHVGPIEPADFGRTPKGMIFNAEQYYNALRMRYVLGVQLMLQLQCEALVEKCGVTPLICGISGSIWSRFVASAQIFHNGWADQTVLDSEKGERRQHIGNSRKNEPRNLHNERMVVIWCRSLKKAIPLSSSLAISYLACHIAREPVLPNDIAKWAIEGKLPYFGVFPKIAESIKQIERYNQHVSVICPIQASSLFSPSNLPTEKLESMAASIAQSVGLSLPPVNFYKIACRYLKQLSLPVDKLIPFVCRIHEWCMPPDLWLCTRAEKLPSRVCVMSILIVTMRILYNLNGFGKWERAVSAPIDSSSMNDQTTRFDKSNAKRGDEDVSGKHRTKSSVHKFESESIELLHNLERRYDAFSNKFEYSKDLPTYLQYCEDVLFAGLEPSYRESTLREELWSFFKTNREDIKIFEEIKAESVLKRSRDYDILNTPLNDNKKNRDEKMASSLSTRIGSHFPTYCSKMEPDTDSNHQISHTHKGPETLYDGEASAKILGEISLRHLKKDMEENRFCYIPPRTEIKRHDYMHYKRKKGDGSLDYVAHADYYILLRACAKVAEVDIRIMHVGVLNLERRLDWTEESIDNSLRRKCPDGTAEVSIDLGGDSVDLSNLNL